MVWSSTGGPNVEAFTLNVKELNSVSLLLCSGGI